MCFEPAAEYGRRCKGRAGRKDQTLHCGVERDDTEMSNRLNHDLADTDGVVVWGVGQLTMKMLKYSPLGSARIVAFADSSPVNRGRKLHGVKIVGPEDLRTMSHPIVIASLLHQPEIAKQIRSMNSPPFNRFPREPRGAL